MKTITKISLLALLQTANVFGQGTVLWNESVNGPLGNLAGSATPLGPLQLGTNSVIGAAEVIPISEGWLGNDDYFAFSAPFGMEVARLALTVDNLSWAFIGDSNYTTQFAFVAHPTNGDLLSQWGLNTLSSGSYGMYIADDDLQTIPTFANYRLDFVTQSVPESSTLSMLLAGAGFVGFCTWRKSLRRRK